MGQALMSSPDTIIYSMAMVLSKQENKQKGVSLEGFKKKENK